jgi:ketosteroid isomerase-like protein
MRHIRQFAPIVAIFLAGCASAPTAKLTDDYSKDQAQIRQRLNEIIDAAQKKDFERLDSYHLYGTKFTKFETQAPGRLDAEAARKGEHNGLGAATDLVMQAEDLKIDVFGDVGIATFLLDYSFKTETGRIDKKALSTLVFVKEGGAWKIAHEHLSAPPDSVRP